MRRLLTVAAMAILLAACHPLPTPDTGKEASIGPFAAFNGRLIVIEPARRWQVIVQWQGEPQQGAVRLTHAASGRIAEIHWQQQLIELRDSATPVWRPVSFEQLAEHGIVLPPQQLAAILAGNIPGSLKAKGDGRWEGELNDSFIRLQWQAEQQRLELTDITHGRRAILIINRP